MPAASRLSRNREPLSLQGVGTAMAHHGELLQGVFEDGTGRLQRGLVTLPLPAMTSRATVIATRSIDVTVCPDGRTKASVAARLTLDHLAITEGGAVDIRSDIPIGHGYGSSTADVVAVIRAVADAYSAHLQPLRISQLAVAAEKASDAIAFGEQALLFAQRQGVVLEHFGGALPPLLLVGFKTRDGLPIDTLNLPPARYDQAEIQQFRVVRGLIAHAVRYQDANCLGRAATASARISQRHLPKEHFDQVLAIAEDAGACGVQVAHSGSLVGIIFDRTGKNLRRRARRVAGLAKRLGFRDVAFHHIHDDGARW